MDGTSNGMQTEWTDGCYIVYRTWDFSQLFLQCSYADCRNITVNFFEECFLPEQILSLAQAVQRIRPAAVQLF